VRPVRGQWRGVRQGLKEEGIGIRSSVLHHF
jgi:hypothetical protein